MEKISRSSAEEEMPYLAAQQIAEAAASVHYRHGSDRESNAKIFKELVTESLMDNQETILATLWQDGLRLRHNQEKLVFSLSGLNSAGDSRVLPFDPQEALSTLSAKGQGVLSDKDTRDQFGKWHQELSREFETFRVQQIGAAARFATFYDKV